MASAEIASLNSRAEALSSLAARMLLSIIRDQGTKQGDYARAADRLVTLLAEEGLARLAQPRKVVTPCGECQGLEPPLGNDVCVVDIMRSGGILAEGVRRLIPESKAAKILIQRDEETALPHHLYTKLPKDLATMPHVLLCDPMLATGGSALMAIQALRDAGVQESRILFLNVVSCPEGLEALAKGAPDVRILTAAVDECLNEQKYIVPGLGDFGDRYFGTC